MANLPAAGVSREDFTPLILQYLRQRMVRVTWLCFATVATLTFAVLPSAAVRAQSPLPPVLRASQAFRGRITYTAYPLAGTVSAQAGAGLQAIRGTLTVSGSNWTLEERSSRSFLHASPDAAWIQLDSQRFAFDDPFELNSLANAWAPALGELAASGSELQIHGQSWSTSDGTRIYVDAQSSDVAGVVDSRSVENIAYTFADWVSVNGLRLPQNILRLRADASDGGFTITDYSVEWASQNSNAGSAAMQSQNAKVIVTASPSGVLSDLVWRRFYTVFGLLFVGLGWVIWMRRDALTDRLCRRLAFDPRGWRGEGKTTLVSPEGILLFRGHAYRVGPSFYNRLSTVQSSPLFLRVSNPQVPHAVVLARKFGTPSIFKTHARPANVSHTKPSQAGFSLVESLVSTALFALVIVAVVLPTLVVLSHADKLAAQRQAALRLASNALTDEEAALEYGSVDDGAHSERVEGMTVTVSVQPAAVSGAHSVDILVSDERNHPLTHVVTWIGPPVPAPGTSSPGPAQ